MGLFSGNAAGHSLGAVLGATALQRALGTTEHYSCLTLDNAEMFVVAEEVFGDPLRTFEADPERSDLVVLFGTDPVSSQASQAQSHPGAIHPLRDWARAGQLVVVDPRRSATAALASTHLAPRLGTDVFSLGVAGAGGGAAGGDHMAVAAKSKSHADFAGNRTHRAAGDAEQAYLFDVPAMPQAVLFFGKFLRAAARYRGLRRSRAFRPLTWPRDRARRL